MDPETVYILADVLFTVGGWQLGKSIWRQKGADPDRGKWYGAILGFMLGFIGIITLVGIAWRWHPSSEAGSGATPAELMDRRQRVRPGRFGKLIVVFLAAAVVLGGFAVVVGNDALRYLRWADQMSAEGARVTRAVCAEVTLDWAACYVPGGRGISDREWRARWSRQGTELGLVAGVVLLGAAGCCAGAAWAWRARSRALAELARRDDAAAAARLGDVIDGIGDQPGAGEPPRRAGDLPGRPESPAPLAHR